MIESKRSPRSIIISIFGAFIGLSGINHGFFEALQGFSPARLPVIDAIGPAQRFWIHGNEPAFTLIPNFLVTGIIAMAVGIAMIAWSALFLHRRGSGSTFAFLCLLLFLFGGGIAQVLFFIVIAMMLKLARRPAGKLARRAAQGKLAFLGKVWPYVFGLGIFALLVALEIGIFGFFPSFSDADSILYACFACLGIGLTLFGLGYFGAGVREAGQ